ncbi:MAG: MotA/TolQ/ExbB proton channel family protein [Lachnospiraceae bacterium]|nr:MotA/TolQ/ExbB proton channel family protein [Lachnospiraceae bacterium]
MTGLLQIIKDNINLIILLSGIVLTALLFFNGSKLSSHKNRIEEAVSRRNKKWGVRPADGAVIDEADEDASITPDTIRQYERDFNKTCTMHNVLAQLIPVFPLLGILGTVVGLMLEASAADIEGMMASVETALSSTFFGLIFAILLKIADAVFPSRIIEDVEVMLEDYGKKLTLADMIQKIRDRN